MIKPPLDQNDRDFLDTLNQLDGASVHEICREIGVTATAIRQRLGRLQVLGLVKRESVRNGRGRPSYIYRVTESGLRELGDNYADLAMVLWKELNRISEPTVRQEVWRRIEGALVQRYGSVVDGITLHERTRQLREALAGHGFDVEVEAESARELVVLRENNCPYHELASADPSICELERQVFEKVLSARVKLAECCLDGHRCCEFQASGESQ